MGQRLIADTSVLIRMERQGQAVTTILPADAELALPAIVLAEYRAGIERDTLPARAARRLAWLGAVLSQAEVLPYTAETASHHAKLLAHTQTHGTARGPHDLIIAAHAAETGRQIVTLDRKARFTDLPGVVAADLGPH
jgi:predicted nucleic acid-binding protein